MTPPPSSSDLSPPGAAPGAAGAAPSGAGSPGGAAHAGRKPEAWPDLRPLFTHSATLLLARVLVGGLFLLAAKGKFANPKVFALSINSFGLVPGSWAPPLAFGMLWTEIVIGICLVVGLFTRSAALISAGLLTVFLGALGWAVLNKMDIDCGCFGALFGDNKVGWMSLLRNVGLISVSAWVLWKGAGSWSVDRALRQ